MTKEIAFITGGASGIGLATAQRLSRDGFQCVIVDREESSIGQAIKSLNAAGIEVQGHVADVRKRAEICAVLDKYERVDVMVTSAGIGPMGDFLDITDEQFQEVIGINLFGTFLCAQEAARRMKERGRIVTISSRAALGTPNFAHYVSSKAGVSGLTRAMALDLRPRHISVNCIAPGFVETGLTRKFTPEQFAAASSHEPTGKPAQPSEIANAIAFFVSPQTSFVTGQTLFVDGGKSLGGLSI